MELTLQCCTISMISPLFKTELLKWTSYALIIFFSWMFTFVLGNRKWIKSVHFLSLILLHCFTVLFLLFLNKNFFVILYCHRIPSLSFYLKQMHLENCNIRIKKKIKKKIKHEAAGMFRYRFCCYLTLILWLQSWVCAV